MATVVVSKRKRKAQAVRQAADTFAGLLACLPPGQRMGWVVYLLERMEHLTPGHEKAAFLDGLESLAADVLTRIDAGAW